MELAIKLNISIEFLFKLDISGSISAIVNNEADICGETSLISSFAGQVAFSSHATMIDKVEFYTSKPKPKHITLEFISQPFKYTLWLT